MKSGTCLNLDRRVVSKLDEQATAVGMSRSEFCEHILRNHLERLRRPGAHKYKAKGTNHAHVDE